MNSLKPSHKPIFIQVGSSRGSSMVPGSVFSKAQNAEEKAEMLETGRLLNINEEVTSSYVLADKGGAALKMCEGMAAQ